MAHGLGTAGKYSRYYYYYYTRLMACFSGQLGKPVPEKYHQSGFKWGKRWWGFGMQRHQLDHMQTICTLLQRDNHTSTVLLNFYRLDALSDAQPTVSKHWRHLNIVDTSQLLRSYFDANKHLTPTFVGFYIRLKVRIHVTPVLQSVVKCRHSYSRLYVLNIHRLSHTRTVVRECCKGDNESQ